MEFNRDVFGVPGNVTQPVSFAPNQLIKQGARVVTSWEYIVEELPTEIRGELIPVADSTPGELASRFEATLNNNEPALYELLSTDHASHVDELVERSGLHSCTVLATLFELEMKGCIRQMPGKQFVRLKL